MMTPHVVSRIKAANGKVLYRRDTASLGRVIDPRYVGMMNQMMAETVASGTARKADLPPGWQAAGKTGTSQEFRDAWFIGYTGNLDHGRLARQRQFFADQEGDRRRSAGRYLEPLHESGASEACSRSNCRALSSRYSPPPMAGYPRSRNPATPLPPPGAPAASVPAAHLSPNGYPDPARAAALFRQMRRARAIRRRGRCRRAQIPSGPRPPGAVPTGSVPSNQGAQISPASRRVKAKSARSSTSCLGVDLDAAAPRRK